MPSLGSNRLLEILLAFPLLYFKSDTLITDFVYALFDLMQPMFWMERFLETPEEKDFCPGNPGIWSLQVREKAFECLYEPWNKRMKRWMNHSIIDIRHAEG